MKEAELNPRVEVRTLEPKAYDYTDEGEKKRKWGVTGIIIAHHNSHGLCYDVKHHNSHGLCYDVKHDDDNSVGTYDPDELEFTGGPKRKTKPEKHYPGRIAGLTC
jgi:hypothetical protein